MAEEIEGESIPKSGDDLDEAAKIWGKELALESGEEPQDEDTQSDPEDSEEDLEEEEVQEDELEDDEEDEETESNEQKYTVRIDGIDEHIGLDELISGYSRQSSFTKKSQALAEDRKKFEEDMVDAKDLRAQAIHILENAQAAQTQAPKKDDQYWQDLKDSDPMQFMLERDAIREEQYQASLRQQQIETLKAQETAEQKANLENYVETQRGILKELIPEWGDQKVADAEKKLILEYGLKVGFNQNELDTAYDARAVATMRKAALLDQIMAKRKGLKPVARTAMKAGSKASDPKGVKSKKASVRLKKSGSIDDAASVFYNMIRSK